MERLAPRSSGEMLDPYCWQSSLVWGQNGEKPADEGNEPKEAVKANVISILKDLYGIEEADLLSAEQRLFRRSCS